MIRSRVELDAHRRLVSELFDGTKQFKAPSFQRPYVWKKSNVVRVCEDVESLAITPVADTTTHFMGAIVLLDQSDNAAAGLRRYLIVDGQQRLTTLFLYLIGIASEMKRRGIEGADELVAQYLANQHGERLAPKVLPTDVDFNQFRAAVTAAGFSGHLTIPASAGPVSGDLIKAYETIRARLRSAADSASSPFRSAGDDGGPTVAGDDAEPNDAGERARFAEEVLARLLRAALSQLKMVEIMLGDGDEPYEVFKTLNTLGVDLRAVDLVRSEIFFKVNASTAHQLFEDRWKPIELSLDQDIDRYFFPYALERDSRIKKGNLFAGLRDLWKGKGVEDILRDIATDVPGFLATRRSASELVLEAQRIEPVLGRRWVMPVELRVMVARLRRYSVPDVAMPFVMRVLRAAELGERPIADLVEDLRLLESFLVRRAIRGVEPTGLHAVFKTLWTQTNGGDPREFIDVISRRATVEVPTDVDFEKAVIEGPLYKRRSVARYVIFELELHDQGEDGAKHDSIPFDTIDHVMPQTLSPAWRTVVPAGDHERLVDTWGNLVPLSRPDNSAKGNTEWEQIRDYLEIEPDYVSTRRLAKKHEHWDAGSIEARAKTIAAWAVKRWPRDSA